MATGELLDKKLREIRTKREVPAGKRQGKEGEGACFFRPIQGFFFDFLVIFTIFGFPVPFKS